MDCDQPRHPGSSSLPSGLPSARDRPSAISAFPGANLLGGGGGSHPISAGHHLGLARFAPHPHHPFPTSSHPAHSISAASSAPPGGGPFQASLSSSFSLTDIHRLASGPVGLMPPSAPVSDMEVDPPAVAGALPPLGVAGEGGLKRSSSAPHIPMIVATGGGDASTALPSSLSSDILMKRSSSPPPFMLGTGLQQQREQHKAGHLPAQSMETSSVSTSNAREVEREHPAANHLPFGVTPLHLPAQCLSGSSSGPGSSSSMTLATPTRSRHLSSSSLPGSVVMARTPSRLHQIRQEETPNSVLDREVAHEREIQSSLQMAQSWTDLHLDNLSEAPKRPRCFSESLHIITTPPFQSLSSPSPTRTLKKQCFSPSMGAQVNGASAHPGYAFTPSPSPSPTRRLAAAGGPTSSSALHPGSGSPALSASAAAVSMARRRSNSPVVVLRPSALGSAGGGLKRKLDTSGDYEGGSPAFSSPKRIAFGADAYSSGLSPMARHPLARSISSSTMDGCEPVGPGGEAPMSLAPSALTPTPPSQFRPLRGASFGGLSGDRAGPRPTVTSSGGAAVGAHHHQHHGSPPSMVTEPMCVDSGGKNGHTAMASTDAHPASLNNHTLM